MKNYELLGYVNPEEGAVKMILSYAIDNYSEYSDADIDELHSRYIANKQWLDSEVGQK